MQFKGTINAFIDSVTAYDGLGNVARRKKERR
jgi:hypothetical protein